DVIIPFFIKKYDNLDFIYPWNVTSKNNYTTENTNYLINENYFNDKPQFINNIRHLFAASSNEKIIDTGIRNQTSIYVILVNCNEEHSDLNDIKRKFLFLTLINPNLNKTDFEKIAKSENEVVFKIPCSQYPIKIELKEVKLDQISQNIQALKLTIYSDDISSTLNVRQCLLDRIHTISNNIQINKVYSKFNGINNDIIYEIKKTIIYTLDSIIFSQKNKE
ncbi:hypothetical protein BCR36DRAFT_261973, partial [Piromyces finnis]